MTPAERYPHFVVPLTIVWVSEADQEVHRDAVFVHKNTVKPGTKEVRIRYPSGGSIWVFATGSSKQYVPGHFTHNIELDGSFVSLPSRHK